MRSLLIRTLIESFTKLIKTHLSHSAGNFICDVMVAATNADFALLNSGTLRSDSVHHAGPFFLKVNIRLTTNKHDFNIT